MSDDRFQLEQQSIVLNADGEITQGRFCAYCGVLNAGDAEHCYDCREYIVDQGPDLSAILARISRHASGSPSIASGVIGVKPAQKSRFVTRLTESRLYDMLRSASQFFWVFHVLALSIEAIFIILLTRFIFLLLDSHWIAFAPIMH